jgi:hypothetical protein
MISTGTMYLCYRLYTFLLVKFKYYILNALLQSLQWKDYYYTNYPLTCPIRKKVPSSHLVSLKSTILCFLLCHKKCSPKNAWDSELLDCLAENDTDSLIMREVFIVRQEMTSAICNTGSSC